MTEHTAVNASGWRSGYKVLVHIAVVVLFAGVVEIWIGWRDVLQPWGSLPLAQLAGALALVFASYLVRAFRLHDYFHREMHQKFRVCFKLILLNNFLNNLLPMRSGELSFPLLMSRYFGMPAVRSLPVLVWFRLLDFHTICWLALVALAGLSSGRSSTIAATVVWIPLPWLLYCLNDRVARYLAGRPVTRFTRLVSEAVSGLPASGREFWRAWAWTLVNWTVKIYAFAWIFEKFSGVAPGQAWIAVIAGDITSILPFHGVAGVGTYEAGVVAALLPLGVSAEASLAAALNLHLFVLGLSLLGGILAQFIPVKRRGDK